MKTVCCEHFCLLLLLLLFLLCPRFLSLFLKVVQKLHKEHISSSSPSPDFQTLSELLQWSLDMCKTRVSVMTQDSRKAFVSILTSLIEKSPDTKLLRMLTKIVEEWVKAKVEACGWSRISLEQLYMYVYGMLSNHR